MPTKDLGYKIYPGRLIEFGFLIDDHPFFQNAVWFSADTNVFSVIFNSDRAIVLQWIVSELLITGSFDMALDN